VGHEGFLVEQLGPRLRGDERCMSIAVSWSYP